ncbi:MAG: hypothetical protein M3P45_01835 [Acidobacteriota bacterium]|nr:hypothetical protein [Acidobacteriota bacterium]
MAQGHGAAGAQSAGVIPAASGQAISAAAPRRNAGASATVGARIASSPGSQLIISRTPSGQGIVRRAVPAGARGVNRGRMVTATRNRQLTASQRRNGISEVSSEFDSTPGLGFDYAHVAATHPNGVNGRHHHGNDFGNSGAMLFPFSGGGYFLPTDLGVESAQGQGSAAEDAEDEGEAIPANRSARVRSVDRLPVLGPPAPQQDVPEYVFVRRDGTVFFAVAYSWEHGSLRYVSSEGLRRSVERETLDLDATQQFNEQRGVIFRAPA